MLRVSIIGGGRWARTIAGVLAGLPAPSGITLHSRHNAAGVRTWIAERGLAPKVAAAEAWPDYKTDLPDAVIVANNAADHDAAACPALDAGVAVLVEKPMAIGACVVRALVERAAAKQALLAASHVFLFTRYIENFSDLVARHGAIRRLELTWQDGAGEIVRGEVKLHDPVVSVFDDVLPHIVPTLARLVPQVLSLDSLKVRDGGVGVTITAAAGTVPIVLDVARGAQARRRVLTAYMGEEICTLDFSTEPGTIQISGSVSQDGDPLWAHGPRPLSAMLTAFLDGVRGGVLDPRLSPQKALASAVFCDTVRAAGLAQRRA